VPHIVPYPLPLECPDTDPAVKLRFIASALRDLNECHVDVSLCRDVFDALQQELHVGALVFIASSDVWWPNYEKRLAKRLRNLGHNCMLVTQPSFWTVLTKFLASRRTTRSCQA
jgi:hypothetical protein